VEDDPNDLFDTDDVLLISVSSAVSSPTARCDFLGVPRIVGDKICREQSSELCISVLVATGDSGNFGYGSFLVGVFTGEADNEDDPESEFPLVNSSRFNTTNGFLTGVLEGEAGNGDDAEFALVTLEFNFPRESFSEYGSFSGEKLRELSVSFFGVVTICRNF